MTLLIFLLCVVIGKTKIEEFMAQNKNPSDLGVDKRKWRVINTKIMNEKRKMKTKTSARWNELNE